MTKNKLREYNIIKYRLGGNMNKTGKIVKTVGIAIFAFGVGILCSFFLPETVLVVIEALVIISVGCLWFAAK